MTKTVITVTGMSCEHCVKAVTAALEALPGVKKADVNLKKGTAAVKHEQKVSEAAMKAAIREAGFEA